MAGMSGYGPLGYPVRKRANDALTRRESNAERYRRYRAKRTREYRERDARRSREYTERTKHPCATCGLVMVYRNSINCRSCEKHGKAFGASRTTVQYQLRTPFQGRKDVSFEARVNRLQQSRENNPL